MKRELKTLHEFDAELIGLLELCKAKRLVVAAPPYKMENHEYIKLARFMKSIGGEWSKSDRCFVIQMSEDFLEMLVGGLSELSQEHPLSTEGESTANDEIAIQTLNEQLDNRAIYAHKPK